MAFSLGDTFDSLVAAQGALPMREKCAPEALDDTSLVRAARDGDRAAFGRLYDRYARMVHGVLLARVPVDEVDDLVQDFF